MQSPVSVVTNKGVLYNFIYFKIIHRIASVNEVDIKFTPFFQNHKSRLYLSNENFFPLKFNESYENWRTVSMSRVNILKKNDLFDKIWLIIKGFVLFLIVFLCKQLYQQNSYILFSFETFNSFSVSLRFPLFTAILFKFKQKILWSGAFEGKMNYFNLTI